MNEKIYLVALHKIWINHRLLFIIFEKTQNYKWFYENISFNLLKKYNLEDAKIENILKNKENLNINDLETKMKDLWVDIFTYFDEEYPKNLKNIFNKPFLLYVRGNIPLPWIAFVGSRNMTSYWKSVIENFIPQVGKYFSIISGWAFGCDSYSHEIALKSNVKTISIIWTGIDKNYPIWNKKLYDSIVKSGGGIISIFPFWEPWNAYNFPIRNEIVAWLS
jgi:DNA processing protein